MPRPKAENINDYISTFPKETQRALKAVRSTIKKALPGGEERISYAIPAFYRDKAYVVYFAGFDKHIGLYPAPVREESFKKAFSKYKTGRGSIQFPLDKPMPLTLITRIVKFRIKQNKERAKTKKK